MTLQQSKAPPRKREGAGVGVPPPTEKTSGASLTRNLLSDKPSRYPPYRQIGTDSRDRPIMVNCRTGAARRVMTNHAWIALTPEQLIDELAYINYRHNRGGMTPDDLRAVYGKRVDELEERYQRDHIEDEVEAALRREAELDAADRAEDAADDQAKELASESLDMARVRHLNQSLAIIEHAMGLGGEA